MPTIEALGLLLAAYLWGSLSPAYVVGCWRLGADLRHYGTGNLGASNIGAQLGLRWKLIVGLADVVKGLAPAGIARWVGLDWATVVALGVATIAGHNWSAFLGFTGGRGYATTVGVLAAWDPRLLPVFFVLSTLGMATGLGSPLSLLAAMLFGPAAWLLGDPAPIVAGGVIIALLVVAKRLDANRLPLPPDRHMRRMVRWRRLWWDQDVPRGQPWEGRGRLDPAARSQTGRRSDG
jgi:glycerol-3-phosphate acyltransferase PlsY